MLEVGRFKIDCFTATLPCSAVITKRSLNKKSADKSIDLGMDDIYHLEFAIKEIKRKLGLK